MDTKDSISKSMVSDELLLILYVIVIGTKQYVTSIIKKITSGLVIITS